MNRRPLCHCGSTLVRGYCQNPRCDVYEPLPVFRVEARTRSGERHVLRIRMIDASWATTEAAQRLGDEDAPIRVLSVTEGGSW